MDPSRPSPTTFEFFPDRPTPGLIAARCTGVIIVALLAYFGIRHPGFLVRHRQSDAVALCWGLLVMAMLRLPFWAREATEAWRGKPLLRLGECGIWIRDWESVGWIAWADVAAIRVDTRGQDAGLRLELRNRRKYLDRMNWIDRLAWLGGAMLDKVLARSAREPAVPQDRSIALISGSARDARWDRLMAALDPILLARGIPKFTRSSSASGIADQTPSALIAEFPKGGPELRAHIAKLVEVDPTMADEVVSVARAADRAQQDAIGAGLADASSYFAKLGALVWVDDADARIRRAIELADEGTRTGWAHVATPKPVPNADDNHNSGVRDTRVDIS